MPAPFIRASDLFTTPNPLLKQEGVGGGKKIRTPQLFHNPPQRYELPQKRLQQREIQRIGPIRERFGGVVMDFHEKSIHTGRNAGAGQVRNVLRLAAGALSLTSGKLQAVSHVEDHRTSQTLHDGERAEVHNEVVVAERGPPLGQHEPIAAGFTRPTRASSISRAFQQPADRTSTGVRGSMR